MTHFTVLIRTELESGNLSDMPARIDEILDPFDENKKVPKYKKYMDKKSVERALDYFKKKTPMSPSGVALAKAELTPEEIKEWNGGEGGGKDAKGYFYYSTYNPKSKWDWYEIGGRWQGMFTLKAKALGVYVKKPDLGKKGLSIKEQLHSVAGEASERVDVAFLKDIDLDGMEERDRKEHEARYDKAVENIEKAMEAGKEAIDKAFSENYWELGIEHESREEYMARRGCFSTHAVVDGKGWHEWSKMGWWATTYDENETEADWNAKYRERFLSNPTDKTVVAVVDCHI